MNLALPDSRIAGDGTSGAVAEDGSWPIRPECQSVVTAGRDFLLATVIIHVNSATAGEPRGDGVRMLSA